MKTRLVRSLLILSGLCIALAGCSKPTVVEPNDPLLDAPADSLAPATQPDEPSVEDAAESENAEPTAEVLPFPERTYAFGPTQARAEDTGRVDRSRDGIVLLGFARVDEPHAVLAINGQIHPLAKGEMHSGIQVVAVAPPQAVLQRGRNRWTATLD